ncbi:hypothetical protein BX616_010076 [Lobosporangium transversale]|nr:hypothetical protein BX616_010076 [Lobosporangium transversale]
MSLLSYILQNPLFQILFSLTIWSLILGIPLLILSIAFYYMARGTGNVAGFVVDKATKRVRQYQQEQRKQDDLLMDFGQSSSTSSNNSSNWNSHDVYKRTGVGAA